jgi:hypothetical protein
MKREKKKNLKFLFLKHGKKKKGEVYDLLVGVFVDVLQVHSDSNNKAVGS